ncbi:MAG: acyltransferase family protein [Synergistaceae bacterium]|nr:acyltransferase family protein [Synergistaceae bacterium]
MRVFGAFAVMVLHVAAREWYDTDIRTAEWAAMNFYDSIVRWAVPVFTMISGALFLSKDIPVRKIYSKYIFRIFTAFLFWSLLYAVHGYIKDRDIMKAAGHFLKGHYHLWFLYMIAGLYMIVPFVKKIAESESLTKYFLALSFLFAFAVPETVNIISLFSEHFGNFAGNTAGNFQLHFVGGFAGYFLLGYFLNRVNISRRAERLIYIAGTAGFTATVFVSLYASRFTGGAFGKFYASHTVNVMLEAVMVFVFFRVKFNWPSRIIRALSRYSFGAYLVHVAVIRLVGKFGLNPLTFSPLISIPVISVIVFVISFGISALLNHIPVLNKYIV